MWPVTGRAGLAADPPSPVEAPRAPSLILHPSPRARSRAPSPFVLAVPAEFEPATPRFEVLCWSNGFALERHREGPVETAQYAALLLQCAVAAHLVLARKHIDGLNAQGLRATCPAVDPGPVRQPDLITDRRVSVWCSDGAVAVQTYGSDGTENRTVAVNLSGRGRQGDCKGYESERGSEAEKSHAGISSRNAPVGQIMAGGRLPSS